MTGLYKVGVDIGGTKTDAVAIDEQGAIAGQIRVRSGIGPDALVASTVQALEELAGVVGVYTIDFTSIGIGIPGTVVGGRVSHALNLAIDGLDLGGELDARLGRSVSIDNDVNAAALGAFHLLETDPSHSMAFLNLGTGLAAGLVLGGQLWRGSRGAAGEIGHVPIDPQGLECPCGQRGCLETVASGSGVARMWPTDSDQPTTALFEAAASGDPAAIAVRARLVENVASAVRLLVLTVDVDSVVLGGGVSTLSDLIDDVRAVLARWETTSAFLASIGLSSRVHGLPADFPAAAVGAAMVSGEARGQ
ncbi:ROK family protein [Salinibacterium sp. PAMC 21357]|uniref:ROK family protein n=1 Tax=Salinibacterium sp. PAMC 21357 TaxID=1112215 RepID=UPI000288023E|nr:ROK family protein [Salinibacterium sp. PAMC 21357]